MGEPSPISANRPVLAGGGEINSVYPCLCSRRRPPDRLRRKDPEPGRGGKPRKPKTLRPPESVTRKNYWEGPGAHCPLIPPAATRESTAFDAFVTLDSPSDGFKIRDCQIYVRGSRAVPTDRFVAFSRPPPIVRTTTAPGARGSRPCPLPPAGTDALSSGSGFHPAHRWNKCSLPVHQAQATRSTTPP